ncbi:alpha-L-fucosidase [Sphingobacterium faecium]|uniref:alpha-L-fucosidase n=1 Tax=Sphingobacterium faecium TaxID=34087 RepID=UPI003209CB4F
MNYIKKSLALGVITLFTTWHVNAQQAVPAPYGALPSADQVSWQKLGYYMFIHFGPNTFTDKEWGDGKESPMVFNPTDLDARQWAKTAKDAGMKAIIITAKHHDGFCLWPSKYSTHTVRESPWKGGKGDVLKDLSEACREYGLKFGVYLSPWDQNHPSYGTPEYNDIFAKTLEEVLTNYGDIYEMWFDGANGEGPNGKKQVYDWPLFRSVVYKHQPHAVIFSDIGPGARWIGNESGFAGETNWSTLNTDGFGMGKDAPKQAILNSGDENGKYWIPGEVDVSIRPGWFYSPDTDDKVKTLSQLLGIYYTSVGRNANLLLNVPVSRTGKIHPTDSTRLMELRAVVDATFKTNLAKGKTVLINTTRAAQLTDGNYDTYWGVEGNAKKAVLTLDLGTKTKLNRLLLQEYIPLGQRVRSFEVAYWNGQKYVALVKQSTIGYKRILAFPTIATNKLRITLEANAAPVLSEIQVYLAPEMLDVPVINRTKEGIVSIKMNSPDPIVTYTLDGSELNMKSMRYNQPFELTRGGTVKAKAFINNGKDFSDVVIADFDLSTADWKVLHASESKKESQINRAFDGNGRTSWEANPAGSTGIYEIAIDMGKEMEIAGFTYTPANNGNTGGTVTKYNFSVSRNGKDWDRILTDKVFGNINNNPVKQQVMFPNKKQARFIKLEALAVIGADQSGMKINEIGVIVK